METQLPPREPFTALTKVQINHLLKVSKLRKDMIEKLLYQLDALETNAKNLEEQNDVQFETLQELREELRQERYAKKQLAAELELKAPIENLCNELDLRTSVEELTEKLADRDWEIRDLHQNSLLQENEIKKLKKQHIIKDSIVSKLKRELKIKSDHISDLKTTWTLKESELEKSLNEYDIINKEQELKRLQNEIIVSKQKIMSLKEEREEIINVHSVQFCSLIVEELLVSVQNYNSVSNLLIKKQQSERNWSDAANEDTAEHNYTTECNKNESNRFDAAKDDIVPNYITECNQDQIEQAESNSIVLVFDSVNESNSQTRKSNPHWLKKGLFWVKQRLNFGKPGSKWWKMGLKKKY